MKVSIKLALASMVMTSLVSCSKDPSYNRDQSQGDLLPKSTSEANPRAGFKQDVVVIKAAGDIAAALNEFRELLGPLNTVPGATGGRREINWDGVPATFTNNALFPGDFFGSADPLAPNGRKRGLISTTPGEGFRISDNDFLDVNPSYIGEFTTFSPEKTFVANASVITDNTFKVPGTNVDATIQGFGVVFSGVNNASSTSIEFFAGDKSLGAYKVPNNGDHNASGFSFLGVYFPNENITRVRIISGNAPLTSKQSHPSDGAGEDIVIMDDFIYSEPGQ